MQEKEFAVKKFLCVFLALFTLTLTGCGGGKEVCGGEGYEFSYSPDKWETAFKASDGTVAFKRKGFDEVSFGVYRYIPEENVSLNERLEHSKEICEANGYIWDGGEITDIDGRECARAEYHEEINGVMYKYVNFICYDYPYAYAIDFTSDIDSYDKCIKEFEEIFDSFKITE